MQTVVFTEAYTLQADDAQANTQISRVNAVCVVIVARAKPHTPVRSLFWLQGFLCLSPGLIPASSPLKHAVLEDTVSTSSNLRADE